MSKYFIICLLILCSCKSAQSTQFLNVKKLNQKNKIIYYDFHVDSDMTKEYIIYLVDMLDSEKFIEREFATNKLKLEKSKIKNYLPDPNSKYLSLEQKMRIKEILGIHKNYVYHNHNNNLFSILYGPTIVSETIRRRMYGIVVSH